MADLTPFGVPVSFGGTTLAGIAHVASFGLPSIDRQSVEAYEQIIGQPLPIDLYNLAEAPRKDVLTCDILVRASDGTTNPTSAWAEVAAGYRGLAGLPLVGTLVVYDDTSASGTVSCAARRKPLPLTLSPKNARYYVATLTFTLLTEWA